MNTPIGTWEFDHDTLIFGLFIINLLTIIILSCTVCYYQTKKRLRSKNKYSMVKQIYSSGDELENEQLKA